MNFPTRRFCITKILSQETFDYNDNINSVLTCTTDDNITIKFWAIADSPDTLGNIEEILKFKDQLPILVECHYVSTTYQYDPTKVNWDDEIDIIDFNVSI